MDGQYFGDIHSNSWNRWFMTKAVRSLELRLNSNEVWLLGALLGTNDDAHLICKQSHQNTWRGKDYLYAFMTEKDIQANLVSELSKAGRWCQVHVEVPIYGRTNRRGRRKSRPFNYRPDILLLSPRRKEKRIVLRENNLEVSAVEIKYFEKFHKPRLAQMVKNDVNKLYAYLNYRVEPKVDSVFFVCVDESGEAENHLKKLFAKRRFKNQRIGYLVIVPQYSVQQRTYPMALEKYEQGLERNSAYVMDKALGMLKNEFPFMIQERLKYDRIGKYRGSAGPWFNIRCGRKMIGWAYFDWGFKKGRRSISALIVCLEDEIQHVGYQKSVKWNMKRQGYDYYENYSKRRVYLVRKRTYQYSQNKMDQIARQVYHVVKKIIRKAERVIV